MRPANKIIQDLVVGEFSDGQMLPPALFPSSVESVIMGLGSEYQDRIGGCRTKLEVLELSVDYLAECAAIAADTYRNKPIPDNAYQLAALTNAHKSALAQLEKMKDPDEILSEIDAKIHTMFVAMVRAMAIEIDKVKRQWVAMHPEDLSTIDDLFTRMTNSVQPETQRIYDDLEKSLKKTLGIKV